MKKVHLILLCLLAVNSALTAQTYRGSVIDLESKDVLPYVNIGVVGKNMGTISQKDGRFAIDLSRAASTDTLRFSMLGYQSISFLIGQLSADSLRIVAMQSAIIDLQTVPVVGMRLEEMEVGAHQKNRTKYGWQGITGKGTEIGKPFTGLKNVLLKDFNFYLSYNSFDSLLFRLNVYEWKQNQPAASILTESIFFTVRNKAKKWISHNLEPYHLQINEDVFVSLELIEAWTSDKNLLFFNYGEEDNPNNTITLHRKSSMDDWEVATPDLSIGFYFTVKK